MAGTWRLGTASMVLATPWTMAGRLAEAQLAPLPLTVAIHDHAALPPPVLERAKGVATTIYERIGTSVTGLAGPQVAAAVPTNPASCPNSPTPLIHLRLLGRSANPHPLALAGNAIRNRQRKSRISGRVPGDIDAVRLTAPAIHQHLPHAGRPWLGDRRGPAWT